jgi:hypothetical protein
MLRGRERRSPASPLTWSTSVHNLDNTLNGLTVAPRAAELAHCKSWGRSRVLALHYTTSGRALPSGTSIGRGEWSVAAMFRVSVRRP